MRSRSGHKRSTFKKWRKIVMRQMFLCNFYLRNSLNRVLNVYLRQVKVERHDSDKSEVWMGPSGHWPIRQSTSFRSYKMGTKKWYMPEILCGRVLYNGLTHRFHFFSKILKAKKNLNFLENFFIFLKTKILKIRNGSFGDLSFLYKTT